MKLTTALTLVNCLPANAKGFTQKLTISHQNVSLKTVFKDIAEKTGYTFLYTEKLLLNGTKVSISANNASIGEVFKDRFLLNVSSTMLIIK